MAFEFYSVCSIVPYMYLTFKLCQKKPKKKNNKSFDKLGIGKCVFGDEIVTVVGGE